MKASKAITKAVQEFDKKVKGADIRTVTLLEGSRIGDDWHDVVIQIEYAIDGDYTQSDANPFIVAVLEGVNGKLYAAGAFDDAWCRRC